MSPDKHQARKLMQWIALKSANQSVVEIMTITVGGRMGGMSFFDVDTLLLCP